MVVVRIVFPSGDDEVLDLGSFRFNSGDKYCRGGEERYIVRDIVHRITGGVAHQQVFMEEI